MWLKCKIGQRRMRHGELKAWERMRKVLYEDCSALDSSAILHYWGAWCCRVARPSCVMNRLVTR